jgi:hypothetical protein
VSAAEAMEHHAQHAGRREGHTGRIADNLRG